MSAALLTALQLADSGFPSGTFAYSWGLERAAERGQVDRRSFAEWLACEMLGRWALFDRVVLANAHAAPDLIACDAGTDCLFWAEPLRVQSAEAGQAFLSAFARLGDPVATRLRDAVLDGRAHGHLPVAQGGVFRSMGLPLPLSLNVAAHSAAQGLASAGVRLGLVGAIEAQKALAGLREDLAEAAVPPPADAIPASFAPVSEIAMLKPADGRLFAN